MVLDGQQRLQGLFIGLKGSYEGRELFVDILSGTPTAPEDIKFRFSFKDKATASWPWVRFKGIIEERNLLDSEIAEKVEKQSP